MSGLRDKGDSVRSNEARRMYTGRLILSGLLTVTAKEVLLCGLFGREEINTLINRGVIVFSSHGPKMDVDIAAGKVGSHGQT